MQKSKSLLSIQIETMSKYLDGIKKQDILDLSIKIFPVVSTQQPYMSLYTAIKKQAIAARSKGVNLGEFANQITSKAYLAGTEVGNRFAALIRGQPQFLVRFDPNSAVAVNTQKAVQQHQEKKQVLPAQQSSIQTMIVAQQYEGGFQSQFPVKNKPSPIIQIVSPLSSPLHSVDFLLGSPLIKPPSPPVIGFEPTSTYKIGGPRSQQKLIDSAINIKSNNGSVNQNNNNNKHNSNDCSIRIRQQNCRQDEVKLMKNQKQSQDKTNQKPKSVLQQRIDYIAQKKKNDLDRLLSTIQDPLSSAKPASLSPTKQSFGPLTTNQNSNPQKNFILPPPVPKQTQFFQPHPRQKQSLNRYTESNHFHNISNRRQCLCETSCDDIVLSEDSFYCQHCENIYHTKCMRKQTDSRNCVICHLKMMMPNRLVTQEIFVGCMRKNKRRHEIVFNISEQMYHFLKSKKDYSHKLQIRSFRLNPKTQNQILFPDSCTLFINGKQLKQCKPLHKQSSLKYRRDQPISILKNYNPGQNKITVNQIHNQSALDRIEPEDHVIGLYFVEEQSLNNTVQRVIKNYVTSLKESKDLLSKAFNVTENGSKSEEEMFEQEAITLQVIKIPLTCALTTEKLNYPARGVFCKHFQCFDLKNYIMMTSSSSNPRWVCPICKASCYEFRIDCILTEILNQYTGCDKVDVLVLYKDGMYEVIDRDEDAIDSKGNKLKHPQPKDISDLKIIDKFKRDRQKQIQKQQLEQQQAEKKKKKKVVQLPPQDQIVCLLSDSD